MAQSPRDEPAIALKHTRSVFHKPFSFIAALLLLATFSSLILAQAGRKPRATTGGGVSLGITAKRADNSSASITSKNVSVYDNGVEQLIRNFAPDPSPARIVLLVDNSVTLRADVEKLEQAAREFAYEIYEGDQILIVGYDE